MRAPPVRSWKSTPVPGPTTSVVGLDPTPPASLSLLLAAEAAAVQVVAGLYASPSLVFDGNIQNTVRRIGVVVPVACRYSRAWVTRCGSVDELAPIGQLAHKHASSTGGGYAGAPVSTRASLVDGTEVFYATHATKPVTHCEVAATGTGIDDAPAAAVDRALATPEGLAPAVEVYQVEQVAGFSVQFWNRTADLETL